MRRQLGAVTLAVALAALMSAAAPPVALRVETAAVRPVGDATLMSVTVQVAPEDRTRLGRDVWVQCELLRAGQRVLRLARALDLDERGQAGFEVAWPAGDYDLRVSIEGAGDRAAGLWVGPLSVPPMGPEAPAAAAAPVAAAVTATPPIVPQPSPRPEPAVAAEVVSDTVPEPAAIPPATEPTPVATAAALEPAEAEPPPEPEVAAPPDVVAEPAVEPPPSQPEIATAAEAVPEPAAEPAPAPVQPKPAATAGVTGAAWAAANPGMADVTVFVTERNRPILGLAAGAFTLRVGGSAATVAAVGDAASAPLNLALVADVAPDAGELADELARQLGRFSLRARNGGDLLMVTTADPRPGWGAGPDSITRWADGAAEGRSDDLAGLVAAAAQAAAGRRGRSVLVVVTDGSDACGKAAWKDAADTAEAAGVPIFTIGLRDSGFDDQARAGLSRIADATGGRSYFLGSAGMAGMTLDYLGELIDASYALAYRPAAGGGPRELKVEAVNRDWQVHHPRRIP